jgi:hypothetical protein
MTLQITTLGSIAKTLLMHSETASVWGNTSQGVFLYLPPKGMIFLSFETCRGPLTVNLEGNAHFIRELDGKQSIRMQEGSLVLPRTALGWEEAEVWEAPQIPGEAIQVDRILARYHEVLGQVSTLREPHFLPYNYNLQLDDPGKGLQSLLGQGRGLTPFGDDVILGCLLTLNRWGHGLMPDLEIQRLSQELVSAAFRQTTLLSANLIDCAAEGQADERLLLALDGIFTGQPSAEHSADWLLSWGESSGCAALTGFGLAVKLVFV